MNLNGLNFPGKTIFIVLNLLPDKVHAFMLITMIICTLSAGNEMYAQCNASTQYSTTIIPCSGRINSVPSVPRLRFIKINVINGVNYTFSSTVKGITLVNDSINITVGDTTGESISYTSTFSGLIRMYNCYESATLSYIANNTASNLQDNQSTCDTNRWTGHLYKRMDDSIAVSPSNNNAFTSYIGYIKRPERFSEDFGGNTNCFPTLSKGINGINTYTELFAAKFCNQSIKPAGAYILSSVTTDDGLRIYVAGALVLDRWINQPSTKYNHILFQHSGNTKLELQYFATLGGNVLELDTMMRVNNLLTTNLNQSICEGNSSGEITGTNVFTSTPINSAVGYNVSYQWQFSLDSLNFSNIIGANLQNYTPQQTAPGIYYFKRLANITNTNPGSIQAIAIDESNVARSVINLRPIGIISGQVICSGTALAQLTFNAPTNSGPFSLIINGITYNNVTSGVPFNILPPNVTTIYNLSNITDINGCINL